MPTHSTTIRYIGQPEGFRSDIPITIIDNCELTPESDVGIHYEPDITGIGLSLTQDTEDSRTVRSLNYDGASRNKAIITLPKQFVTMFNLSGDPILFFPGRGGLVAQIPYTPRLQHQTPTNTHESTVSDYKSGHYGIRAPAALVNGRTPAETNLLDTIGENIWLWLDVTTDGDLAIIADTDPDRAPDAAQEVSANPSMLYRRDGEIGYLFPIPVGDILLAGERTLHWERDGTRLIAVVVA